MWKGQCFFLTARYYTHLRNPQGEAGGMFGVGMITRSYRPGSSLTLGVDISANHLGYFEFRLCPRAPASQACLDNNVLRLSDGEQRFYIGEGTGTFTMTATLPSGVTCGQCVLQWIYKAGV